MRRGAAGQRHIAVVPLGATAQGDAAQRRAAIAALEAVEDDAALPEQAALRLLDALGVEDIVNNLDDEMRRQEGEEGYDELVEGAAEQTRAKVCKEEQTRAKVCKEERQNIQEGEWAVKNMRKSLRALGMPKQDIDMFFKGSDEDRRQAIQRERLRQEQLATGASQEERDQGNTGLRGIESMRKLGFTVEDLRRLGDEDQNVRDQAVKDIRARQLVAALERRSAEQSLTAPQGRTAPQGQDERSRQLIAELEQEARQERDEGPGQGAAMTPRDEGQGAAMTPHDEVMEEIRGLKNPPPGEDFPALRDMKNHAADRLVKLVQTFGDNSSLTRADLEEYAAGLSEEEVFLHSRVQRILNRLPKPAEGDQVPEKPKRAEAGAEETAPPLTPAEAFADILQYFKGLPKSKFSTGRETAVAELEEVLGSRASLTRDELESYKESLGDNDFIKRTFIDRVLTHLKEGRNMPRKPVPHGVFQRYSPDGKPPPVSAERLGRLEEAPTLTSSVSVTRVM